MDTSQINGMSGGLVAQLTAALSTPPPAGDVAAAPVAPAAREAGLIVPPGVPFVPPQAQQPQVQQPAFAQPPVVQQPQVQQPLQPAVQNPLTVTPPQQVATETVPQATEQQTAMTDAQMTAINDAAIYNVPQGDGTTAAMTGLELRQSIMRNRDYTQKNQQRVAREKELDSVVTEHQQLRTWQTDVRADLSNPRKVYEHILATFGPQFVQEAYATLTGQQAPVATVPGTGSDQIATIADARNMAAQNEQRIIALQRQHAVEMAQVRTEIQTAETRAKTNAINDIQTANARVEINHAVPQIIDALPIIKTIPRYEDLLRFNVQSKYRVTNAGEAIAAYKAEAQLLASEQTARLDAHNKAIVVANPQAFANPMLINNGVQNVGPAPVVSGSNFQPSTFVDANGKVDKKAWTEGVMGFMRSQIGQ